jgi:hypothetical protein
MKVNYMQNKKKLNDNYQDTPTKLPVEKNEKARTASMEPVLRRLVVLVHAFVK